MFSLVLHATARASYRNMTIPELVRFTSIDFWRFHGLGIEAVDRVSKRRAGTPSLTAKAVCIGPRVQNGGDPNPPGVDRARTAPRNPYDLLQTRCMICLRRSRAFSRRCQAAPRPPRRDRRDRDRRRLFGARSIREAKLFPSRGVKPPSLSARSQPFVDVVFGSIFAP